MQEVEYRNPWPVALVLVEPCGRQTEVAPFGVIKLDLDHAGDRNNAELLVAHGIVEPAVLH